MTDSIWIDVDFDHGRVRATATACRRLADALRDAAWVRGWAAHGLEALFFGGHAETFAALHAEAVTHHHRLADRLVATARALDAASDRAVVRQADLEEERRRWHQARAAEAAAGEGSPTPAGAW